MPATYSPRPTRTEPGQPGRHDQQHDPGFGGRPPGKNRPTGGGGDGDNGDDGFRSRGPRELLQRYRLVLSFVLAADLVFFLSLVSAFFVRHTAGHFDAADNYIADWRPLTIPTSLWVATGFLILSSATIEFGRRQMFREMDVIEEWLGMGRPMSGRTWPWLAATAGLGGAYLFGVWTSWREVGEAGFRFASSPDSAFFFVLTGSHALHIAAGLLLLAAGAVGLYRLRKIEQRQVLVDCIAWFWHTMGAFWVLLFALLLLAR